MWPNRATIAMVRMLGRWAVLAQVRYTGRHLEADLRHYIKRGSGRHGRGLRHNSGAAAVLGAWLALTLEVCLERVGSVAQVPAPDDAHHRSEQPDKPLWKVVTFHSRPSAAWTIARPRTAFRQVRASASVHDPFAGRGLRRVGHADQDDMWP